MTRRIFSLALLLALALAHSGRGDEADEEKLPAGAVARMRLASSENAGYDGVYRVLFTPDGQKLITRSLVGQAIDVWDASTGKHARRLEGHERGITSLAISFDGAYLISAADDRQDDVRVWDIRTGDRIRTVPGGGKLAQILPDQTTLVVVSDERIVHFDMATGGVLGEFPEVRIPLALSPDGKTLAAMRKLDDDKLVLIETTTGKERLELPGLTANPAAVVFSPDGQRLAVAGR
ncbi:MAG: hypothetical protein KDA41_03650, partial [Planctomycetales bacterium]|nr:hypothetical protein [Planctomycetales bacterium]